VQWALDSAVSLQDGGIRFRCRTDTETTRNPAAAAGAWWCETGKAGPVIREARRHTGDILAAARALGVTLTDHATVLARTKAAVARIEAGMAWAQRTGPLHEFNQEYRRRRLEAQRRGERFMGYAQATARLRCAITKVAATGSARVAIVRGVLGDVAQSPLTPIAGVSQRTWAWSGSANPTWESPSAASTPLRATLFLHRPCHRRYVMLYKERVQNDEWQGAA